MTTAAIAAGLDEVAAALAARMPWPADNVVTWRSLNNAVQRTPDGGTLTIPAGTWVLENLGAIEITKAIHVVATGVTLDCSDWTHSLFDLVSAPDGIDVSFTGGTFIGPTTGSLELQNTAGVYWARALREETSLTLTDVTILGQWGSAVSKAGGGTMVFDSCELHAWVSAATLFGGGLAPSDTGEAGSLTAIDTVFDTENGKSSSVGVYIHPQMDYLFERCTFRHHNRFGIYSNGQPEPDDPVQIATDCVFHDCDIIQVATRTHPVLNNPIHTGTHEGPGNVIKGSLTVNGGTLSAISIFGYLGDPLTTVHDVTFVGTHFEMIGGFFAPRNLGTLRFTDGCVFDLVPGTYAVIGMVDFSGTVDFDDTVINELSTSNPPAVVTRAPCTVDWGTSTIVTTRTAAESLQLVAGTTEIGAPTFVAP